jgi:L-alanine-DL-glutamate epimerase-like enolase superfamily enzyme
LPDPGARLSSSSATAPKTAIDELDPYIAKVQRYRLACDGDAGLIITALETLRTAEHENLVWLRVETDSGVVGTGETFFHPGAVEAYLHESVAPVILGRQASGIGAINTMLVRQPVGYASSGVEMRGASAVDMALWDIAGQRAGMPLFELLGGAARPSIRIYNTCAGPNYVRKPKRGNADQWFGLDAPPHPLDDLRAFEAEPARLAADLLAEGITGMKIWPFDRAAFANGGVGVTTAQIEDGLRPFRLIRAAHGAAMDLMVEMHGLWDVTSAERIIRAVEPLEPLWIEDPVRMDDIDAVAALARGTRIPILACETLAPASAYRPLIASGAAGIVCFDPGWCGGVTQARAICDMAAAAQRPVAVHDCTGPIGYIVGTHLSIWAQTAMIQETVRAYLRGWYADAVTALPEIASGRMAPLTAPGIGAALDPGFFASAHRRRSEYPDMNRTLRSHA